jgi:phosphate transport system substrate-binding protein
MNAKVLKVRYLIISLIGVLSMLSCQLFTGISPSATEAPVATIPSAVDLSDLTAQNYPRVDGSTSAYPLEMRIACELLAFKCEWVEWFDGTQMLVPDTANSGREFPTIQHNGTHAAYVNLINGDADLILVARSPSPDELDLADSKRVELDVRPIALDAFVFILNIENSVDSLTIRQIQGIYTGAITDWKQVGGDDAVINPYQRNDNSGSQELMKSLVMNDLTMISAPEMMLPSMLAPINAISDDALGIGYSVYFYEQFMAPNQKLKLCGVEGVIPDYKSIQSRSYPYTTEVYAVMRTDQPPDSLAYLLRDWVLTADGQATVAESGYVPLR